MVSLLKSCQCFQCMLFKIRNSNHQTQSQKGCCYMIIFGFALAAWIVAVPFGYLKPSVDDEEMVIIRRKRSKA